MSVKKDLMCVLTNTNKKKEFLLTNPSSFVEIKEILLTPLFDWGNPNEWSNKRTNQGLYFNITVHDNKGGMFITRPYYLDDLISLNHRNPKTILNKTIAIPLGIKDKVPSINEYPIKIVMELFASVSTFEFDVLFVYDQQ